MKTTQKMMAAATVALMLFQPLISQANPQHDRMRNCNKTAKEKALKGDERKAFMKTCLSGKHADTAPLASAKPVAGAKPVKK